MNLKKYLDSVLKNFTDSRVVRNIIELAQTIIEHQTIRLWSIARDRAAFERSKRLLNGSLKSVLDADTSATASRERCVAALGSAPRLNLFHDPGDIRKLYMQQTENIGKVRDLDGEIINGYNSFATAAATVQGDELQPADITIYSNGDPHYVTVAELQKFQAGKLQTSEDETERDRAQEIADWVAAGDYINLPRLAQTHIRRVSEAFKSQQPEISLCHVLDRQFDGKDYFKFIDQELHDEFVIRLKISRNSNVERIDQETGETQAVKLKDVALMTEHTFICEKLKINHQVYQDAKCVIAWGTLTLEGQTYTVVRITLQDRHGQLIYEHPMLLLTNIKVRTATQARDIYFTYLMRAKIEAVFKFLKTVLGWEEFQIRDYESIRNLLAFTYFIGGYFYEIGSDLTENPTIAWIAQLGGGKGQVTRYYFLQGLGKLLTYVSVNRFFEEHALGDKALDSMFAFVT
jgi:hypothetical protein